MNYAHRMLAVFVLFGLLAGCARATPTPVAADAIPSIVQAGVSSHISEAQALVDMLVQGEFEAACERFGPDLKEKLTQEKLEEAWKKITSQAGDYQTAAASKTEYGTPGHVAEKVIHDISNWIRKQ